MLRPALLALLALASPLSAQQIWTVDDDGPADFASLQAAADFAADGDTLLVRGGTYGALLVLEKGLTIQAAPNSVVKIDAQVTPIEIRKLGPQQAVLIRGIEFVAGYTFEGGFFESIRLENCMGPILFEDCHTTKVQGEAAVVRNCASVTFVDCTLVAAKNVICCGFVFFWYLYPFPGVVAEDSSLFLFDCDVQGGDGLQILEFESDLVDATPGNPAVSMQDSTLLASGCSFTGGQGGDGDAYYGIGGFPAPGGAGLALYDSVARIIDCALTGGSGGVELALQWTAPDGPPYVANANSLLVNLPGNARSFRPASPVTESSPLALHFEGDPGDVILVHVALGIAPGLLIEPLGLALHLTWPYTVFPFGALPATGVLDLSLPAPALPPLPGYEHILFTAQALFVATDGGLFDGGPRTVLITSAQL